MDVIRFDIQRFNERSFDSNLADINQIYADFLLLGIPSVPVSRIRAYRDAFEQLADCVRGERDFDIHIAVRMLNAIVEFYQLRTIVNAAKCSQEQTVWRERLIQLISGLEFSNAERNAASARDYQFETFVGAVCSLSAFNVNFAEPDLLISFGSDQYGVAAKRPRNPSRIDKCIRKAVRQIRNSKKLGIVAIDLSYALYRDQCINTTAP